MMNNMDMPSEILDALHELQEENQTLKLENKILRRSVRDIQEQLSESYIRILELKDLLLENDIDNI